MHVAGVPRIRHFVAITYQASKSKTPRFITQGLVRFGLPEFELQMEYPIPEAIAVEFIYAVAQKLMSEMMALITGVGSPGDRVRLPLEIALSSDEPWDDVPRSPFRTAGATDSLVVRLRPNGAPGKPEFILLRPPRDYPGDARGWLEAASRLITGNPLSTDTHSDEHIGSVDALELAEARRKYDGDGANCPPLAVRYRVSTPFGQDCRWMAVTNWSGKRLRGHGISGPDQAVDYMAGRISEVDEKDVVGLHWKTPAGKR